MAGNLVVPCGRIAVTFASGQCRLTASMTAAIDGYFSLLDFLLSKTVQRFTIVAFTHSLVTPQREQLNRYKLLRCTALGPISQHPSDTLTVFI